MPQMLFWCPLKEVDCRYETRLQPPALFHILSGQPLAPSSFLAFGQVPEWAARPLKAAKPLK
jgi:hypothetical protein